jgi:hypothetical protein
MALSTISGTTGITDATITSAKLADFSAAVDLNGVELLLDADQDTSISADTDDQIDIKIAGADDFQFTANTFTALAGSSVVIPDGGLTLASTAVTSTAAEINLIDGGTARGTTAVASGDGILINDAGTMRMTNVDTVSTYFSSHNVGGGSIVTTGALDSGSITSGFGNINTGSSTITTTGAVATGDLTATGIVLATTDTDATNTGSVTLDFSANQNFVLTLTGNVTLANPSTENVGQSGFIAFIQDGTGSRTITLGTDYETAGAAGLTLTSTASATDLVPYLVVASNRILLGTPQLAFA